MIQIRDDFVRAVQSVMERLKTDPSGAIANAAVQSDRTASASSLAKGITGYPPWPKGQEGHGNTGADRVLGAH